MSIQHRFGSLLRLRLPHVCSGMRGAEWCGVGTLMGESGAGRRRYLTTMANPGVDSRKASHGRLIAAPFFHLSSRLMPFSYKIWSWRITHGVCTFRNQSGIMKNASAPMTLGEGTAQKPFPKHGDKVAGTLVDALTAVTLATGDIAVKHASNAEKIFRQWK